MKKFVKKYLQNVVEDVILVPFVYIAAVLLKAIRRMGVHRLRLCKAALMNVGVFPIRDHYYEPQFDNRNPNPDFSEDRNLPGIDWNLPGQLAMLDRFIFSDELADIPQDLPKPRDPLVFFMNNGGFGSGDAECWYQIIRAIKPRRIFEVGSGNSTLMAIKATRKNQEESRIYKCEHICIEPY